MKDANVLSLRFVSPQEQQFQEEYAEKSLKAVRLGLVVGIVLYAVFGILDAWSTDNIGILHTVWTIRGCVILFVLIPGILTTFTRYFKRFMQWILMTYIILAGSGIVAMTAIVPAPENYSYYAGLILVLMYSYTFLRLQFVYATAASLTVSLAYEVVAIGIAHTPFHVFVSNNFFFIAANVIGMLACYMMELYIRREFVQRHLLLVEEEKTERLLLNIMPRGIAERLKQSNSDVTIYSSLIVDKFPEVTVMFADIAEFTDLSSRIAPEALVVFLNELFFIFDTLAEKYKLEKIKTIGDSYMVVGGLPDPNPNHAENIADMALEMQSSIAKIESAKEGWLKVRIGIHTGPVVAGVIGRKKFSYDLWGNTVNVASRMEHYCAPNEILASEATYRQIHHLFQFEEQKEINIKGKGMMKTYVLKDRLVS